MPITETRDVAKWRPNREQALSLAKKAAIILSVKGKKHITLHTKDNPTDEDLAAALLGPTGAMRAPALWVENTLLIGFTPELYKDLLGT